MNMELLIEGKTGKDVIEVVCSHCSNVFATTKREVQKRIRAGRTSWCCSKECAYSYKKMPQKECPNCKKEFQPTYSAQIYCSQHCSGVVNSTGVRRHGVGGDKRKYGSREIYNEEHPKALASKAEYKLKHGLFADKDRKTISKYLIKFRGHQCSICGITEWCGQPVPIVVDHIDGNADNNFETNLRLVCANCDRQLPTSKGKNRGFGRKNRKR